MMRTAKLFVAMLYGWSSTPVCPISCYNLPLFPAVTTVMPNLGSHGVVVSRSPYDQFFNKVFNPSFRENTWRMSGIETPFPSFILKSKGRAKGQKEEGLSGKYKPELGRMNDGLHEVLESAKDRRHRSEVLPAVSCISE